MSDGIPSRLELSETYPPKLEEQDGHSVQSGPIDAVRNPKPKPKKEKHPSEEKTET